MITYRIDQNSSVNTGNGGLVTTYLLFFEDLKPNQHPDMDFNDMVVEIKATQTQVPEPASTFGLLGFTGLLLRPQARLTESWSFITSNTSRARSPTPPGSCCFPKFTLARASDTLARTS